MRPMTLELQAFGPFGGRERIDFTSFGENPFFLIHGPTGAGKTSVLDGICYALYGLPSGSAREERTLRSHFAHPHLPCEVTFTFQVGPRRYHVTRSPEQVVERKGKLQKIPHRVEFCEIDESGGIVGERLGRVREVQDAVERILGFTAEQFRQVVVLPQGEFRKLLLASSTDKERILEKLFATERFKRVEQTLKERSSGVVAEIEKIRNTVRGILEGEGVASDEELAARGEMLAREESELAARTGEAAESLQRAMAAVQQGELENGKFARLDRARQQRALLEERRGAMEEEERRLERGKRALSLVDLDEALASERRRQGELTRELEGIGERGVRIRGELSVARALLEDLRRRAEEIPTLTAEKGELERRRGVIAELARLEGDVAAAESARSEAAATLDALQKEVTAAEESRAGIEVRIDELSAFAGRRGELEERLKRADELRLTREDLAREEERSAALAAAGKGYGEELERAVEALRVAESRLDEVTRRFIHGQGARLARELKEGEPCPVCGSLDHPAPAAGGEGVPSDEELELARRGVETARQGVDRARETLRRHEVSAAEVGATVRGLRERLGENAGRPVEELRGACEALRGEVARAREVEENLARLRSERERVIRRLGELKERIPVVTASLHNATARAASLKGELHSRERDLGEGTRDVEGIVRRIGEIDRFIADITARCKAAEAQVLQLERQANELAGRSSAVGKELSTLDERLEGMTAQFRERLDRAGFADEDDFRSARIAEDELHRLEGRVREYREALRAAENELNQAEAACEGLSRPDMTALLREKEEAEKALTDASAALGGVKRMLERVEQARQAIASYRRVIGEREEEYRVIAGLAKVAGGENPKRITLQRFVLASLFEDVAHAASARLSRMTRGRYHLRRVEGVVDARKGAGLDLEVTDDFTGLCRPASSLSGGETFLASLSLALGLSDIVLAQSGGRYLDTLFIDEGFGTLDPETLDIAMDTLMKLNESGRMVGIISHVSELKEQIPSRLEVLTGRGGSRVRVVC